MRRKLGFRPKYSDTLEMFLGADFEELDEGIHMHLNQYVTEMMSRFEIGEKTAPTPEASESDELSAADQALLLHFDKKKYQPGDYGRGDVLHDYLSP